MSVLDCCGRYRESLICNLKFQNTFEEKYPSNYIDLALIYSKLAFLLMNEGNNEESNNYYLKCKIFLERIPPDSPILIAIYNNLGILFQALRDLEKALIYYIHASQILENAFPTNQRNLAIIYNNLGNILYLQNDHEESLKYLMKSKQIFENLPPNSFSLVTYYNTLGAIYGRERKYQESLNSYLACERIWLPANHSDLPYLYINLAKISLAMCKYLEASEYILIYQFLWRVKENMKKH